MDLFLSWSGKRSQAVAKALKPWLSQVIQAVEPWISSDIDKGTRWSQKVAERLERSKVGIICLTPENLSALWILFEAGALSKTKDAYVCTFLLDLSPEDVAQPLSQFQLTTADKADCRKLIGTINEAVRKAGERDLSDQVLDRVFETNWPGLEAVLATLPPATPHLPLGCQIYQLSSLSRSLRVGIVSGTDKRTYCECSFNTPVSQTIVLSSPHS